MPPREAETRGAEIGSVPSGAREIPKGFLEFSRQTRMKLSASSTPQTRGPLGAFPEFLEAPGAKWISLEDRFGTFGSTKSSDEYTRRDCMVTQLPPAARKLCVGEDPVRGMGGFLDAPPPLLREGCPTTPSFSEEPAFPEGFFFFFFLWEVTDKGWYLRRTLTDNLSSFRDKETEAQRGQATEWLDCSFQATKHQRSLSQVTLC